jgi:ATP-dependent 26S proteasome regulatory subunit
MSIIASSFANLASGLIIQMLPTGNNTLSLQLSMFTKDAIMYAFDSGKTFPIMSYFCKAKPHIIVSSIISETSKPNPIYNKLEQYIIDKYMKELASCQVIPKGGDIEVSMSNLQGTLKNICDTYNNVEYLIKHVYTSEQIQTSNGSASAKSNSFIIESKNGSIDEIKKYIKYIFELNKMEIKVMHIYQPRIYKNKDLDEVIWESVFVNTNRNIINTVLDESLEKDLIADIDTFLKSKQWYNIRGVPYKRGYILHGPPGTGKTSIIKALANSYNLPIFTIDFDIINTNNKLTSLINNINYYHKNSPYILFMDDVDRSKMFDDKYSNSGVSPDCLLSVLDGVVEPYGRIVVMNVNNFARISNCYVNDLNLSYALLRPGRIDRILNVDYLKKKQSEKMIKIFYDIDIELDFDPATANISPAELVQIMQIYATDYNGMLDAFRKKVNCDHSADMPILKKNISIADTNNSYLHANKLSKLKKDIKLHKKSVKQIEKRFTEIDKEKNLIKKKEEQLVNLLKKMENDKNKIKKEKKSELKKKATTITKSLSTNKKSAKRTRTELELSSPMFNKSQIITRQQSNAKKLK